MPILFLSGVMMKDKTDIETILQNAIDELFALQAKAKED